MNDDETADIPSLQAVLASYLRLVEAGEAVDRAEWARRYPQYADDLRSFFAGDERLRRLAREPQEQAGAAPAGAPGMEPTVDSTPRGTAAAKAPSSSSGSVASLSKGPGNVRYFGDYELIEEIARGGMGVVYKARQVRLNRPVALKMILAGRFAGPEEVQRFFVEAEAAANLDHPGIVPIYEIGTHEGSHYYSMGYVEGQSLASRLATGPLPPREAAELMNRVAEAVQYAHERGVVHRDLKPANILLDRRGSPRVTDFGLAKRLAGASDLTGTGQILGTPSYMPPEQAQGDLNQVGPRSDVYSLGAVLYCAIVGRPPFQAANPLDTLMQVLHQEIILPRKLDPSIPRDLETVCAKCLEKSPDARYATAGELADDLRRFLEGEPVHARPLGPIGRARRWLKRRPLASGCAALTTGLALIAGGIAAAVFAFAVFVSTGFGYMEDREAPAVTLPLAQPYRGETGTFTAPPGGLHDLTLKTIIRTPEFETDAEGRVEGRYNFLVEYEALAEDGSPIVAGSERIVWNASMRQDEGREADEKRGEAKIDALTSIAKFPGPPSGRMKVRIEIGPDEMYGARIDATEVRLYENVRDTRGSVTLGGALCVASPFLLLIGVLLSIVGPVLMAVYAKNR